MIKITVTEVDSQGPEIECRVVSSFKVEDIQGEGKTDFLQDGVRIYGEECELMVSVVWISHGLSLSIINDGELAFRFGGIVVANSHFGYSVGPGKLVEIFVEAK